METRTKVGIGIFVLLSLLGGGFYFAMEDSDKAYKCDDRNIVGICFELSNVNNKGTQTRCYYNETNSTRYKFCKDGWKPFNLINLTGDVVVIPDNNEPDPIFEIADDPLITKVVKDGKVTILKWCLNADIKGELTEICESSQFGEDLPEWDDIENQIRADAEIQIRARLPTGQNIHTLHNHPFTLRIIPLTDGGN